MGSVLHEYVQSGGKRLQAAMTLMAYTVCGKDTTSMLNAVAAQELLMRACLFMMTIDRDYMRYNTLNIAGRYKEIYSKFLTSEADQIHFAHSAAILAGDLMLSGASRAHIIQHCGDWA